ncbi:hypothetical protein EDD11_000950 [Mortierella claussenii]|nr:hypothetical protein EDD11_000950 [Mortierella claussenii]
MKPLPQAPSLAQEMPSPVQEMAFMRVGRYLYVQGGKSEINHVLQFVSSQFCALDLSQSWSVDTPVWRILAPGPSYFLQNGIASPDNKTLTTFYQIADTLMVSKYDIAKNTWEYSSVPTLGDGMQGLRSILDPHTGLVYLNGVSMYQVYSPTTGTMAGTVYAPNTFSARVFAAGVYNIRRDSILYIGGLDGELMYALQTSVTEFKPASGSWGTFATTGDIPTPRADHCMVSSEDGGTLVVYGGRIPTNTSSSTPTNYTSTLYTLDVSSAKWTQRPSSTNPRLYMACVIIEDQFVVWGGSDGESTVSGAPLIFNLTKNEWVDSYTAPAYSLDDPGSTPSNGMPIPSSFSPISPSTLSSSPSNLGAILGGTFGTLLVIALAGLIYLYMKNKSDRQESDAVMQRMLRSQETIQQAAGSLVENDKAGNGSFSDFDDQQKRNPHAITTPIFVERHPQDIAAMGLISDSDLRQSPTIHGHPAHFGTFQRPHHPHQHCISSFLPQTTFTPITAYPTSSSVAVYTSQDTYPSNIFIPTTIPESPIIFKPHAGYEYPYSPQSSAAVYASAQPSGYHMLEFKRSTSNAGSDSTVFVDPTGSEVNSTFVYSSNSSQPAFYPSFSANSASVAGTDDRDSMASSTQH